jgi:hypothetical protein
VSVSKAFFDGNPTYQEKYKQAMGKAAGLPLVTGNSTSGTIDSTKVAVVSSVANRRRLLVDSANLDTTVTMPDPVSALAAIGKLDTLDKINAALSSQGLPFNASAFVRATTNAIPPNSACGTQRPHLIWATGFVLASARWSSSFLL